MHIYVVEVVETFDNPLDYYDSEPPSMIYFFSTLEKAHDYVKREFDATHDPDDINEDGIYAETWTGANDEDITIQRKELDSGDSMCV